MGAGRDTGFFGPKRKDEKTGPRCPLPLTARQPGIPGSRANLLFFPQHRFSAVPAKIRMQKVIDRISAVWAFPHPFRFGTVFPIHYPFIKNSARNHGSSLFPLLFFLIQRLSLPDIIRIFFLVVIPFANTSSCFFSGRDDRVTAALLSIFPSRKASLPTVPRLWDIFW